MIFSAALPSTSPPYYHEFSPSSSFFHCSLVLLAYLSTYTIVREDAQLSQKGFVNGETYVFTNLIFELHLIVMEVQCRDSVDRITVLRLQE